MSILFYNYRIRERVEYVKNKVFPAFENQENQRSEFLPVEWRSSLKLDGGKYITDHTMLLG